MNDFELAYNIVKKNITDMLPISDYNYEASYRMEESFKNGANFFINILLENKGDMENDDQ